MTYAHLILSIYHMTKVEETIADSPDMLWACAVALSLGGNAVVC